MTRFGRGLHPTYEPPMNIHIDDHIFRLQQQGGISRLWRSLMPELAGALPDATFDADRPADLFISTYYRPAPRGVKSVVLLYDAIHERLPSVGRNHPDAMDKRAAIQEASAVIAISQSVADDCQRYFGRAAAVAYCGGSEYFTRALPSEVDAFQRRHGILHPYVLMVGRRGGYKNGQSLYQAWGLWQGAANHLVLCVGGEDSTPADAAFDRALPQRRRRLALDDATLAAAYSGATALVYPSLYEGFGLPLLEALACCCPVVIGADGAGPEVAGEAGVYCDPLRPLSLAQALNQTLDPSLRLERAMAGYQQAKQFTWAKMARSVAEVIRTVV